MGNYAAPMNTPSGGGHSVAGTGYTNVGSSSGRYNNVGNVAAPMNTPSSGGHSIAGSGYANVGSGSANTSSDPYSIPWTDTQRMRNELDDLETQQNDLLVLNGGYMTTDILPQYRAYQNKIDQLNKKLAGADTSVQNYAAPMNTPGSSGRFATLGDAYEDFLEQEGVVFKDSAVNSNAGANGVSGDSSVQNSAAPMNTPQSGSSFDNSGYANVGSGVNPNENDNETAAQEEQTPVEAEKDKAKEIWKQYTDAVTKGGEDAYLASLDYGPGLEGFAQLYDYMQETLGEAEFEKLLSGTNPEPTATISAPDAEAAVSNPTDYYVDPDDYGSDDEYNKALLEGLRHNIQNGNPDVFLLENGYSSGAGGMMALNSDVEEALGKAGFQDFVDQLNADRTKQEQNIAALSGVDEVPTMEEIKVVLKEENEFFIDRDDYQSEENYKGAILEAIAQNPKHTNDILKVNGYTLPDAKRQIDNELKDMHPHYVEGSVQVIDGPFEGSGMVGVNDLVQGITGLLDASGETEGAGAMTPEIPSSSYEWYIVSADFDLARGVENDTF